MRISELENKLEMAGRPKGYAKTGGRKRGTPNKTSKRKALEVARSGEVPLDFLLRIMRDARRGLPARMEAATRVLPYCHPRIAAQIAPQNNLVPLDWNLGRLSDHELAALEGLVNKAATPATAEVLQEEMLQRQADGAAAMARIMATLDGIAERAAEQEVGEIRRTIIDPANPDREGLPDAKPPDSRH